MKNGSLTRYNRIKDLAEKNDILLNNKSLKNEMDQNGYKTIIKNYLLDITNKKMLELYKIDFFNIY